MVGSLVILALSVWRLASEFPVLSGKPREIDLLGEFAASPVLQAAVVKFALGVLLLYVALGLVAWLIGRLFAYAWRVDEPRRRRRLVLLCLIALYGGLHLYHAAVFPNSIFAAHLHDLARGLEPGVLPAVSVLAGLLLATSTVVAWRRAGQSSPQGFLKAPAGVAAAVICVGVALTALDSGHAAATNDARPNVFFIGIDSLRCDVTALGGTDSLTPHVDTFLADAHVFTDTTTPLARTFPAWVSLLTGRHPVATGARTNLAPRELVDDGGTIADWLRSAGYRTVLATDEVRFSNIDESYGFDRLIAPPMGIADFVLATVNDLPLTNLVANSRLGAVLFPHSYANRAAFKVYDPQSFVGRLGRELGSRQPVFAAIHLTLPHWPYAWKDLQYESALSRFRDQYPASVRRVDAQFGSVMDVLARKGLLGNAIVVLLSDHGEAVGEAAATRVPRTEEWESLWWGSLWGHGTSVLNPHQYRVLFAARAFGNAAITAGPHRHGIPATIEDIAPTVADLLGVPRPGGLDGVSLAGLLDGSDTEATMPDARIRFTETEYSPAGLRATRVDEQQLAAEARSMYTLQPDGRLVMTGEARDRVIRSKELAALRGDQLLASLPRKEGGRLYLWFDGRRPFPANLGSDPAAVADPDVAALLAALRNRFPGET